jgi:hypothetical protein
MLTIKEKSARLASATKKVYDYIEKGGDIKSPTAIPVAVEMVERYADLAKEFGDGILKAIKKPGCDVEPPKGWRGDAS